MLFLPSLLFSLLLGNSCGGQNLEILHQRLFFAVSAGGDCHGRSPLCIWVLRCFILTVTTLLLLLQYPVPSCPSALGGFCHPCRGKLRQLRELSRGWSGAGGCRCCSVGHPDFEHLSVGLQLSSMLGWGNISENGAGWRWVLLGRWKVSGTEPSPGRKTHHLLGSGTPVQHPEHLGVQAGQPDGDLRADRRPGAVVSADPPGSSRPQRGLSQWVFAGGRRCVGGPTDIPRDKSVTTAALCPALRSVLPAVNNAATGCKGPLEPPRPLTIPPGGSRLAQSLSAQTKAATKGIRLQDWITVWPPVIPTSDIYLTWVRFSHW